MPHDTYFSREMPLYVDYIEYDQKWSIPSDDSESHYFTKSIGLDSLSVLKKSIIQLMKKLIVIYPYQKEQFLNQFISVGQFIIF